MKITPRGKLLIAILLYAVVAVLLIAFSRMMLWMFNTGLFPPVGSGLFLKLLAGGLLFDFSTFCMLHLIIIPFLMIPYIILKRRFFRIIQLIILALIGFAFLAPNLIDVIYFRFTLKRTTFDVFYFLGTMENEIGGLSLRFITDFWYMFLLFFALFAAYFLFLKKTLFAKKHREIEIPYLIQLPLALLFTAIIIMGARGSFNIRPLGILHATKVAGPEFAPLVTNSTFTMIKTFGKKDLERKSWFDDKTVETIFTPAHYYYKEGKPVRTCNVVIIICESLSAEQIGFLNQDMKSYTPFLDSLCTRSLVFTNMYANGKKSMEGIPAVLSGLPAIMQNPFLTSMYAGNQIDGIGNLLIKNGYESAFFHGGHNGTMNFDGFAAAAGFSKYFGKDEYTGPDSDFDGRWGIFDEPFLQFMVQKCNTFRQPFVTGVFTLSAHHPYSIPNQHRNRFPKGPLPILETIAYSDYALQRFFEAAAKTSWYKNTLFIITSDHASELYTDCYKTVPANHAIPMIWFSPADSSLHGQSSVLCQQTDILPSLADYMNIKRPVYSFGNSVFSTSEPHFAVMLNDVVYQLLSDDGTMLNFDGETGFALHPYSDCRKNKPVRSSEKSVSEHLKFLKAYIQQFNNRSIDNRLTQP